MAILIGANAHLSEPTAEVEVRDPTVGPQARRFMDVLKEMKHRWKEHKKEQMRELEPWKVHAAEAMALKHRQERQEQEKRELEETNIPEPEELMRMQKEARRAKFGDEITVTVRDNMGRSWDVKIRNQNKMRLLMKEVGNKIHMDPKDATFMHKDRKISEEDTPESFGLIDGDVVEVGGAILERAKEAKKKADKQAFAKEKHIQDREAEHRRMLHQKAQAANAAAVQAFEVREAKKIQDNDMLHLRFRDANGTEVRVAAKRQNYLGGVLGVVADRMGFDKETVHFTRTKNNRKLWKSQVPAELEMEEDEVIAVGVGAKRQ